MYEDWSYGFDKPCWGSGNALKGSMASLHTYCYAVDKIRLYIKGVQGDTWTQTIVLAAKLSGVLVGVQVQLWPK